ncbi:class I SAM-dependent methyltransferase [Patescibacteria group bacterium]
MKKLDTSKKDNLRKGLWSSPSYYDVAKKGSLDMSHPGMKVLLKQAKKAKIILDIGCGEGTRLSKVVGNSKAYGIDISRVAIKKAKDSYPKINFIRGDVEKLPYKDEMFDLVYSAFVLEHLDDPEKVLNEAIRVTKNKGVIVLVAPNYGAPSRISPPNNNSRLAKLIGGFAKDIFDIISNGDKLNWNEVDPIKDTKAYKIDYDVVSEPYLGSLRRFLKHKGMSLAYMSSCWDQELENASIFQKLIKLIGTTGLYPFWMWGPHLVVVVRKENA